jgi:hypothetical protein
MSKPTIDQSTRQNAPEADEPDAETVIRERLKTYERDKALARPWPEVKARLLRQPKA